jgi:hypothetical protein
MHFLNFLFRPHAAAEVLTLANPGGPTRRRQAMGQALWIACLITIQE